MVLAPEQKALAAEWRERNPQTPEEVAAFYRDSRALAGDITSWHVRDERRQAWTRRIVQLAQEQGVESVLDVGCGDGEDLRALADAGVHWLCGVEPNQKLRVYASADERPAIYGSLDEYLHFLPDPPHLTLLMDVLEHVPNAPAFLDRVIAHIPVGGWLVEATPTWDIKNPTHLKENWGWSPVGQLRKNGFSLVEYDAHFHIWQRTAESIGTSQTAILVAYRAVAPETVTAVSRLHHLGSWTVLPHTNDALVSRARSMAVSTWWRELPDDVCLQIDADIVFDPHDAMKIVDRCRNGYPVISAAYAVRDGKSIASRIRPGETVEFHAGAEPVEIDYAATGFMAIHRSVVDALIKKLPLCHADRGWSFWPMFDCEIVPLPDGNHEYASEDWAFCNRVREAGFQVYLDPSIRLKHLGMYAYELEDVVTPNQKQHYSSISFRERERTYE